MVDFSEMFITVNGTSFFHGVKPFQVGSILKLVKDPENLHDGEAIKVLMRYAGQVGFVANSPKTVAKGAMSAGRIYDKIMNPDYAKVRFIFKDSIIAQVLSQEELEQEKSDENSDVNKV